MILIIDDEKNIRRTLAMVVEGEDYTVETAASGEEGLTVLKQAGGADTVFLDVMLPGIGGLETLKRIKAFDPNIEVVMISGHASVTDAVDATRLGAFDFLEKPLD
ncbi:MAG: response regulator, partial [Myxococcota bacterium]